MVQTIIAQYDVDDLRSLAYALRQVTRAIADTGKADHEIFIEPAKLMLVETQLQDGSRVVDLAWKSAQLDPVTSLTADDLLRSASGQRMINDPLSALRAYARAAAAALTHDLDHRDRDDQVACDPATRQPTAWRRQVAGAPTAVFAICRARARGGPRRRRA